MTVYDPSESGVAIEDGDAARPRRSGSLRSLLKNPLGISSLIVILVLATLGLLEPILSTHSPVFASTDRINAPVGTAGWPLGADQYGRDIWARSLVAINVSVISAVIGASVAIVVGGTFGLIAGYKGGSTDAITSWSFNLLMTFPALVLVVVLTPVIGDSYQVMMAVFGLFLAPGVYRLVRNLVVGVRNELYIDAARVSGLSNRRILSRHVLYVIRGPVIIFAAYLASAAISVQSGLAFLGIGSTQVPSFGSMTGDAFLNIYTHPVQLLWPSLFLALLNGSLILLGNAYRDALASSPKDAKPSKSRSSKEVVALPTNEGPDTDSTGDLLSVRNLWVHYEGSGTGSTSVVRGVSLDVQPGEIVGLVGESGSGKTQTAFSILRLLPEGARVTADELSLAGESLLAKDAAGLRALRGGVISYVPQEPMSNLDPSFTIGSQLLEGLKGTLPRREAKQAILDLLARVGIPDPKRTFDSYPHQISGGMAQRVLIAGAVVSRPKLLIADEPTTALDVTVQAEILDLLRELRDELGMGVLLVTHNFGVVADLCDRVIVMRNGELVDGGGVRSIFNSPSHPYTRELIDSILDEDFVRDDEPATSGTKERR